MFHTDIERPEPIDRLTLRNPNMINHVAIQSPLRFLVMFFTSICDTR